ncbi:MAG: isoaspartyl peptidase/L-asparaginase [Armatimonadetes bacterium]|nr:isoaspartyl peptidase/L-asparaginase [Armatimonadota bacterium]
MPIILGTWKEPGQAAVETAAAAYQQGKSMTECLEAGLARCEDDPEFIAIGRGSLPNSDGELELDASIMDGRDLNCGAVCAMRGILPAITVARWVKDKTPHVMLAGDQARRFAIENGLQPQNLMTAESVRLYEEWKTDPSRLQEYVHTVHDTVTMLGRDDDGHFVAASSTSGWSYKKPGRVGDSPIVGAGIYADDEAGAAGATGLGEELWKAVVSFRTVQNMRAGMTAQQACEESINQMVRRQPKARETSCVVLATGKDGSWGAACTTGTFHLWVHKDGQTTVQEYTGIVD